MAAAIDRAVVYNLHKDVADKLTEDSEQAFVEGSFRQALQLANACLEGEGQSETDRYRNTDSRIAKIHIPLQTPIELTFDTDVQRRWITLDLNSPKETSRVDRAAAVALQSWFEISQKAGSQQEQARGYRHLLPFLNEYTASHQTRYRSRCRSISLELMIIFLQFCHATQHFHMAVELGSELIHILLSSFTSDDERPLVDSNQQMHFQELLIFLLTRLLPFCDRPKAVTDLGNRLAPDTSSTEWTVSSTKWNACSVPSADSVRGVLLLLGDGERLSRWPGWSHGTIVECRTNLEILLQDLEDHDDDGDKAFLVRPHSQDELVEDSMVVNGQGIASPRDGMSWQDSWVARLVRLVRVHIWESMKDHRGRATAAVTILTLWMAWHQRRRLVTTGNANTTASVVRIVLKPLLEIVDALMPGK